MHRFALCLMLLSMILFATPACSTTRVDPLATLTYDVTPLLDALNAYGNARLADPDLTFEQFEADAARIVLEGVGVPPHLVGGDPVAVLLEWVGTTQPDALAMIVADELLSDVDPQLRPLLSLAAQILTRDRLARTSGARGGEP